MGNHCTRGWDFPSKVVLGVLGVHYVEYIEDAFFVYCYTAITPWVKTGLDKANLLSNSAFDDLPF